MPKLITGRIVLAIAVSCVFEFTAANAQYSNSRISRPSAGASTRVGRTGGRGTAVSGEVRGIGGASEYSQGLTPSGKPDLRRLGAGSPLPPIDVPFALQGAAIGFSPYPTSAVGPTFRYMDPTTDQTLRSLTDYGRGMGNNAPLFGVQPHIMSLGQGTYFAPKIERDAYAEYFDLTPTRAPTPALADRTSGPVLSLAGRLELENDAIARQSLERGHAAFRAGTTLLAENRYEHLARAIVAYQNVMRMDRENFIAPLLIAHAALAKDQFQIAGRALIEAANRKPSLFEEPIDLTQYYGDAAVLDEQMRRHLRTGDQEGADALAYAIQAYAAYVLGDRTRSTEALDRMEKLNRDEKQDARMRRYGFALASAIIKPESAE